MERTQETSSVAGRSHLGSVYSGAGSRSGASLAAKTMSRFGREFHEKVVVPLLEQRRGLAGKCCLERGTEVVPRSAERSTELRHFLKRVRQKLEPATIVPLALQCGTRLLELGEFSTAAECFFDDALMICDSFTGGGEGSDSPFDPVVVISWRVDAIYGRTECDLEQIRCDDTHVRFPRTAQRLFECLRRIRHAMADLLALPQHQHERVAWLLLNGAGILHCVAEPLANAGGNFARSMRRW